jgi:hypothetical protein
MKHRRCQNSCQDSTHKKTLLLIYIFKTFMSVEGKELNKQLDNWLNAADLIHGPARAIIAP